MFFIEEKKFKKFHLKSKNRLIPKEITRAINFVLRYKKCDAPICRMTPALRHIHANILVKKIFRIDSIPPKINIEIEPINTPRYFGFLGGHWLGVLQFPMHLQVGTQKQF